MAYTSVPLYLDLPNWQQQQQTHQQGSSSNNTQLQQLPPPPPNDSAGSIGPVSTADRNRLPKAQQPESSQKCPRCESTNTKFCYFNNYSLSQPRHFCKTCRRYWTRGGALRNVPVGGGCRRNKRSKGNSSKSQVSASSAAIPGTTCTTNMNIGHMPPPPLPSQLPRFASVHHLSDYGTADTGLNFSGLQRMAATSGLEFQMIGENSGTCNMIMSGPSDRWRSPFLAGMEPPPGLYPLHNAVADQISAKTSNYGVNQVSSVKIEGNHGFNLSRQVLGGQGNDQYWGGGSAWTDLSGFTSSSH